MDLKGCVHAFFLGLYDSIRGFRTLYYLDQELDARKLAKLSPTKTTSSIRRKTTDDSREQTPIRPLKKHEESKVWTRTIQCCALNGGVFVLSMYLFHYAFLPGLGFLLNMIFGESSFVGRFIWSWMKPVLTCIYQILWVVPIFLLSKVVNSLWFQDIADSAYRYSRGRPQYLQSISILLADSIFSIIVQALFLMQAFLVSYIPIYMLGHILSLVHMCMLYSLYAFEYKWFNMAWELHRRLTYIEMNWPYFIGFGLPLALITGFSDSWVYSGAFFAIFFPLFIVSANEANPVTGVCDYPLRLFAPVILVSNKVFVSTIHAGKAAAPVSGPRRR